MLKRIRYFLTVARLKHFGAAARELHISQPPLSQQIRLLEREMGIQLFTRTTRRVELTEAGRVLYDAARHSIDGLDNAIARAKRVERGDAGHLRLAFVSSSTSWLLAATLRAFRRKFPDATVELFHMTSTQQAEALLKERIDAGFLRDVPAHAASMLVHREPLLAALPPAHRLAHRRTVAVADLDREPFIMWDRKQTGGIAATVLDLCRQHRIEPRIILEVTNPAAMLSLAATGMGIAIVPLSASRLLRADALAFRPMSDPRAYSAVSLAWRANDDSKLVANFVEVVRAVSAKHPK